MFGEMKKCKLIIGYNGIISKKSIHLERFHRIRSKIIVKMYKKLFFDKKWKILYYWPKICSEEH